MSEKKCASCFSPKANLNCKTCLDPLCKKCANQFTEDRVAYLDGKVPEVLKDSGVFCNACFEQHVVPVISEYDEVLERAKEVFVFFIEESKETRLIRRSEKKFNVAGDDKEDLVLKLGFLAAKSGFNAVVDIDIKAEKRRDGSFKLVSWTGSGAAAQVDAAKYNRKK